MVNQNSKEGSKGVKQNIVKISYRPKSGKQNDIPR